MLPHRPVEVIDRIGHVIEARRERPVRSLVYETAKIDELLYAVSHSVGADFAEFLGDEPNLAIEREVSSRLTHLLRSPFKAQHSGDLALGRFCYAACRTVKPAHVIETGVAYGVTSSFILQALDVNGAGELHSIDLPPLSPSADMHVGTLIPNRLRYRWQLHRGPSKRILPNLARKLAPVGVFVHDSLHTHSTISFELRTVLPHVGRPAFLIADDIGGNSAFKEFVKDSHPAAAGAIVEDEKVGLFGAAYFA